MMRRLAASGALCLLAAVLGVAPAVSADVTGPSTTSVIRDGLAAADVFGAEDSVEFGTYPADIAAEPSVAVDPTDARHALVAFKAGFGQAIGYAVTTDAGRTWSATQALPRTLRRELDEQTFIGTTDPVAAFGPDGTAYVSIIGFTEPRNGFGGNVEVVSLRPGATSWSGPYDVIAEPALAPPYSYPDKDWMVVDTGRGPGHHPGRLYVTWSQEPLVPLATFSDDAGRTWQPVPSPILPSSVTGGGVPTHGTDFQLVVLHDGPIKSIADLKGKRIGYSVGGFEEALLTAMLGKHGLTLKDVTLINVNFSLSPSLMAGQVEAVIGAYRNFELNQMDIAKRPGRAFYPEENGVPPYDVGKFPNKWRKMWRDQPARTLMAHLGKDSYSHIHYDSRQARTISVREAARLQSFPDGFSFCGTMNPAFRQIGNAVPPLLAKAVATQIMKTMTINQAEEVNESSRAAVAVS